MFRARTCTATTLARDTCPASSTNSVSIDPLISARAQSQAVPATTSTSPAANASSTCRVQSARLTSMKSCSMTSPSSPRCIARIADAGILCRVANRLEKVADHLVAVRGDAHLSTGAHEIEDHPRPRVRLARARRSLDGKGRAIQLWCQATCGVLARLSDTADERLRYALTGARRPPQAAGLAPHANPGSSESIPFSATHSPETHQRVLLGSGVDRC